MKLVIFLLLAFVGLSSCNKDSSSSGEKPKAKPNSENQSPSATGNEEGDGNEGDNVNTSEGDEPGEPDQDRPLTCEERWRKYVDMNNEGDFCKWKIESKTIVSGNESVSTTFSKQTIAASSEEKVDIDSESEVNGAVYPSSSSYTREQFMESCDDESEEQEYEQGEETITVEAGTFDTEWIKVTRDSNGNTSTSKTWTKTLDSGYQLLIKSDTETSFSGGLSTSIMELIETNRE